MEKDISSVPEAALFRSIAVIILIAICASVFLNKLDWISDKSEEIAKERVLAEIEYSLAMMLYDYTIKGELHQLEKFDRENPFVPLAIYRSLPSNYRGAVPYVPDDPEQGWYYDVSLKHVVYFNSEGVAQRFVLKFDYEDINKNGMFDRAIDKINGFTIKKSP